MEHLMLKEWKSNLYDLTLFNQITEWSSGVEQLLSTGECEMFCSTVENFEALIRRNR